MNASTVQTSTYTSQFRQGMSYSLNIGHASSDSVVSTMCVHINGKAMPNVDVAYHSSIQDAFAYMCNLVAEIEASVKA